jgi:acetyl-CoA carboxylase carboxyl transferase subunit alpha
VPEPLGGAHRNFDQMAENLKQRLLDDLADLAPLDQETLLDRRYQRLMNYGYV